MLNSPTTSRFFSIWIAYLGLDWNWNTWEGPGTEEPEPNAGVEFAIGFPNWNIGVFGTDVVIPPPPEPNAGAAEADVVMEAVGVPNWNDGVAVEVGAAGKVLPDPNPSVGVGAADNVLPDPNPGGVGVELWLLWAVDVPNLNVGVAVVLVPELEEPNAEAANGVEVTMGAVVVVGVAPNPNNGVGEVVEPAVIDPYAGGAADGTVVERGLEIPNWNDEVGAGVGAGAVKLDPNAGAEESDVVEVVGAVGIPNLNTDIGPEVEELGVFTLSILSTDDAEGFAFVGSGLGSEQHTHAGAVFSLSTMHVGHDHLQ